jgi:hypothetical protein
MRFRSIVLLVLWPIACAATDRTQVSRVVDALPKVDDSVAAIVFVQGAGDAGVGGSTCAKHLQEMATADPSRKMTAMQAAILACPRMCVPLAGFADIRSLQGAAKTAKALEICDAAGADPVFGDLADQREQMDATQYLITRMVVEQIWADLGKDSAEGKKLDALRPKLARSLVLENPALE